MTHPSLWRAALVSIALVAPLACGSDSPFPPTQPGEPVRTLQSLSIEGPSTVAPGQQIPFIVTGLYSDGARENLNASASWNTRPSAPASVDRLGLVTGREPGTTTLGVGVERLGALKGIIVVPAGTFRVAGRVLEADTAGPIRHARIEVVSGTRAGLFTASNDQGAYALYGVSGPIELRVIKAGYEPQVMRLTVNNHLEADAGLVLTDPRPVVTGTYELRLTLDPSCGGSWPDSVRTRRYTAAVQQGTTDVTVTLSGARFAWVPPNGGGRLTGRVEPPGLTFDLSVERSRYYGFDDYPDVTEILEDERGWLIAGGAVVAARQPDGFAGTMDGPFAWYAGDPLGNARENNSCIGRHGFVLRRTSN